MSKHVIKQRSKNRALLALGLASAGVATTMTTSVVAFADVTKIGAGDFDLTKQATEATFPVMFDRPSGVNAAALAGAIRNLGSDSDVYKSAVASVPELANATRMQSLLQDAMSTDETRAVQARTIISKLINWYNGYAGNGGVRITALDGTAYTPDNLDKPINVLGVAFSNNNSINSKISTSMAGLNRARTVTDVMTVLETYSKGVSNEYKTTFDSYAAKVYAPNADIKALSTYDSVKPVLDAYERMYANGASAIRRQLLDGASSSTEAGVAFFESAVITGQLSNSDGGSTGSNTPGETTVTTRWVDETGKELTSSVTGKDYGEQKTFDGYTFTSVTTNGGVRTYVYTKKTETPTPEKVSDTIWVDEAGNVLKAKVSGEFPDNDGVSDIDGYRLVSTRTTSDTTGTHVINTYRKVATSTEDTVWVDEAGTVLKAKTTGTFPDNDGTSDIPGYTLVGVKQTTDTDGNKHTVNTYKKNTDTDKPDTYWFDDKGTQLKNPALDQTLPDNDGVSDIEGYTLIRSYTVTKEDIEGDMKDAGFGVGDTINIYKKAETPKTVTTKWVDETGKALKDPATGSFPDKEGDDIPGYTLVNVTTDNDGNVTNVYKKNPETPKPITRWVDTTGKTLKPNQDGQHPDNDGKSDIPGYNLVRVSTDNKGNVTNVYEPVKPEAKPTTKWVDESGKELQPSKEGQFPDNDGVSDIKDYVLVSVKTDDNGNVVNTYRKPVTKWVDEKGKDLQPPKDGQHPDNDGKSDIKDYVLVSTKTEPNGDVVNTYRQPITNWVDESGKALQVSKVGQFPDNDGKSDIVGYSLVRTVTEPNGDVTNIYKVNAKQVTTHWVDQSGKRLADDQVGDNFGEQKTFDGYEFVEVLTSKDGLEKTYVYKQKPATPAPAPAQSTKLPETGDASGLAMVAQGTGLGIVGFVMTKLRRRKRSK